MDGITTKKDDERGSGLSDQIEIDEWRTRSHLALIIKNIPSHWMVADLKAFLDGFGNVVKVVIFENRETGQSNGRGKVIYRPVPDNPFWEAASEMGSSWFGLQFRLEAVNAPLLSNSGRVLPRALELPLDHFSLGSMIGISNFLKLSDSSDTEFHDCILQLNIFRRQLELHFVLLFHNHKSEQYKIILPLKYITPDSFTVNRRQPNPSHHSLFFEMSVAPQVWKKSDTVEEDDLKDRLHWREHEQWIRQCDIVPDVFQPTLALMDTRIIMKSLILPTGRWKAYCLRLSARSPKDEDDVGELLDILKSFNIKITEKLFIVTADTGEALGIDIEMELLGLPYNVRYSFDVCLAHGYLNEYSISKRFIDRLKTLPAATACGILDTIAAGRKFISDPLAYLATAETTYKGAYRIDSDRDLPAYCKRVQRCLVTPTSLLLKSPSIDVTNRVIRHFIHYLDRFLRVTFTDEDEQKIQSSADRKQLDEVYTRVYRTLKNGISVGGRHFEFLAFGNSQLRDHGCYMFNSDQHLSADMIREWMGIFDNIKTVAKYAARLGQCFSTTRPIVDVDVIEIPDIEYNSYCFSDGVGKISKTLAELVTNAIGYDPFAHVPSAFQFRLGGYKGVLAIDPEADGRTVFVRPSQRKFPSYHNTLEIIRASRYSPAHLNRQIITILSSLGIPDNVFLRYQKTMLESLDTALNDDDAAVRVLNNNIDGNGTAAMLANLIQDGFRARGDIFVQNLFSLFRAWSLRTLLKKARIHVPGGAFLLGVVDETNSLRGYWNESYKPEVEPLDAFVAALSDKELSRQLVIDNMPEIFVQISDPANPENYKVITGICILVRSPAFHPGDIRVVKAVDCDDLLHLHDVVVLPANGDRDLASQCSGGDLDGDDYTVIWAEDLIPENLNEESMSYTPGMFCPLH